MERKTIEKIEETKEHTLVIEGRNAVLEAVRTAAQYIECQIQFCRCINTNRPPRLHEAFLHSSPQKDGFARRTRKGGSRAQNRWIIPHERIYLSVPKKRSIRLSASVIFGIELE